MPGNVKLLIIFGLLFIVASASADPLAVSMISSKSWVVANGVDQANISIHVTNTSYGTSVSGAAVTFTVNESRHGTMAPVSVTTDSAGNANSTFTVKKTSGTATIKVSVHFSDGMGSYSTEQTLLQKIDHDTPYSARFEYPFEGTVATEVPFNVSLTDAWGNRIDDRKQVIAGDVHTIRLQVHGPDPDDCGFLSGATHDIPTTLDANGNTSVMVKLTSTYGPNSILMDAYGSIPEKLEWIVAVTSGTPFTITQTYDPAGSPPQLPADGTQKFTIKYMVYDRFGNPTNTQPIKINTSVPGEDVTYISNSVGQVWFTYGPKSFTGDYTITATAVNNNSVSISNVVRFFNTSANSFEVTANPQTMASHDANPDLKSRISAKVIDIMGNPVKGESVTFSINTINVAAFNQTAPPTLVNSSAVTDENGIAAVQFIPGTFNTDRTAIPGFNSASTGTCKVTATWNGIPKDVSLVWKNYPYLSAVTKVSPSTVKVNETVDVTLTLNGDGWALVGQPADIVIVTDLAGGIGGANRLADTKKAEIAFINNASENTYISLVSFGRSPTPHPPYASANTIALWNQQKIDGIPRFQAWSGAPMDTNMVPPEHWNGCNKVTECPNGTMSAYTYLNPSPDAQIEMDFTTDKAALISVVNGYQDYGGTNYGSGINAAIKEFDTHGTPGHNWTIIIMGDGVNMMAPSSPGSLESYWPSDWYPRSNLGWMDESDVGKAAAVDAANRAKAKGITIYAAGFPTPIGGGNYIDTELMTRMASPGCYYYAPTTDKLSDIFQLILGQVQTKAGVNTTAVLDFGTITINNVSDTSGQVFVYVPDPPTLPSRAPGSTHVTMFDKTHIISDGIINQWPEWNADKKLTFNIGTVNINETWETTFRFKVLKEGNINVFGNNSVIRFEDSRNTGIDTLILPPTFITASQNLTMTGMTMKITTLENLRCVEPGEIKALLPVAWNTRYTGIDVVTERVYYSVNNKPYIQFAEITGVTPGLSSQQAQLDVTKLPPGGYQIKVVATAPDTPDTYALLSDPKTVGGRGITFIKIE
jgi:hypothetical protein